MQKNGRKGTRQQYKCAACSRQFLRRYRREPPWIRRAYNDYVNHRQTLSELSETYGKDSKTIRKYFDRHHPVTGELCAANDPVNLILDATFFRRGDGYMVARAKGKNLYWFPIETEKVEHYEQCLVTLEAAGFRFRSFTIDGRRGVRKLLQKLFPGIPIQHCQFHQIQTITHKLTQRPKLEAGKELRKIALMLARTTRGEFTAALDGWYERWGEFLKERTYSEERKRRWRYTHERLRSAYFSLRRNLPWLFTYLDYPELTIPNTTNSCDGSFSHWKNKVILHRGIRRERKQKMINCLLERHGPA